MQASTHLTLPEPDAVSAAHSNAVAAHIREQVQAAGGRISFAEFMHHVLYAPGLGYYAAGATKFGVAGDFVTAPEVSPVFGRVLARQCAPVLHALKTPGVLEFGAGSGRLAVDLLQKLAELDALPDYYAILDVSADLRHRQQLLVEAEIPEFAERVRWLDDWPDKFTGVVIANEVLDALPTERFRMVDGAVHQVCVEVVDSSFGLCDRPGPTVLEKAVRDIEASLGRALANGYESEVCLAAPPWVAKLGRMISDGAVFLFDYGVSREEYYSPQRSGGWLRCHFRHHAHNDALILPGIQDVTSWVDFTAVAAAALDSGLRIAGFASQAQFLIAGGLDLELQGLADMPADERLKLSRQVKLLTLPAEMGEHFKCLGLMRGPVPVPGAFQALDRIATL
jgi:SAM-dependent MidA family methyltransferase